MVVSFDVGSAAARERFLAAPSWSPTRPASAASTRRRAARALGRRRRARGLHPLSAGCEDTADLLADVERALDAAAS
jgi:cystathionine beta-lyase/cystathionine gamma-synthase